MVYLKAQYNKIEEQIVMHEYALESSKSQSYAKFDAVILAVYYNKFKDLDFQPLKKINENINHKK